MSCCLLCLSLDALDVAGLTVSGHWLKGYESVRRVTDMLSTWKKTYIEGSREIALNITCGNPTFVHQWEWRQESKADLGDQHCPRSPARLTLQSTNWL